MFKNVNEMLEFSQALDERGASYKMLTPEKVVVESEEDFAIASSILEDYDVELVLERKVPKKTESALDKPIGLRDLLGIFRSVK